ncbi:hypothetical protein GGF37_006146, partial [Kickxella alabastrina]
RRRSLSRVDPYPVEQVVELCVKHGFDLTVKLLYGLMHRFDRESVSEAADVFASLTAIVSEGPSVVKSQFDGPPAATMCEWVQATIAQIPDANYSAADKQDILQELSELIQARNWPKVRILISDFAAVFWRRNASKN